MVSSKETTSIPKFNGKANEYDGWKRTFKAFLSKKDTDDEVSYYTEPSKNLKPEYKRLQVLLEDINPPQENEESKAKYLSYQKVEKDLQYLLQVSLPKNFSTNYAIGEEKPNKVYKDLERRYGTATSASIARALTRFDREPIYYENVDAMIEQVTKRWHDFNKELNTLLDAKQDKQWITEEVVAIHLLRCLPQDKECMIPVNKPSHYKYE